MSPRYTTQFSPQVSDRGELGIVVNETQALFLHPKTPVIARTLYNLSQNPYRDCYPSNILRQMPGTATRATLHKALRAFEERDWIERGERAGQTKPITLTTRGEQVFSKLVDLIEILEDDPIE